MNENIYRTYKLDYLGKYYFYEEDDLVTLKEDGQYIIDNLKQSNRFDYNGASYKYTKFGNISEGITERNVPIKIEENNINVKINGEIAHLDLIYKMDIKKLEDHYRITTRVSEKSGEVSCLLYINLEEHEDFVKALGMVRSFQMQISKNKSIGR